MRPTFRRGQRKSYSSGLLGELAQAAVLFWRNRIQNENRVFCIMACCFLAPRLVGIILFFPKESIHGNYPCYPGCGSKGNMDTQSLAYL